MGDLANGAQIRDDKAGTRHDDKTGIKRNNKGVGDPGQDAKRAGDPEQETRAGQDDERAIEPVVRAHIGA